MNDSVSRKRVLIDLLALPLAAAGIAAVSTNADAAAALAQSAVAYQNMPKNGQKCIGCKLYIPAKSNPTKANGACQQVKGSISPNGWCQIYVPKGK